MFQFTKMTQCQCLFVRFLFVDNFWLQINQNIDEIFVNLFNFVTPTNRTFIVSLLN